MNLADISIKNPVFAWMLMFGLILFGAISLTRMGISEMPDVDFPVVNISVTYEGAAPEIMESDVVDVIEDAVLSIQGIRNITSSSRQEEANITIEFELNRDIDVALQEVQTKIAQAQNRLPTDIDPPIVTKTNPEDQPIMWISLSGDKPLRFLMEYARDQLKDKMQTVSGVGEVLLSGFVEPNLRIWIDPQKLDAWELTVQDVIDAVQSEHREIPAGRIETKEKEYNLRSMGEVFTPEEFGNIVIRTRGGQPIYKPIYMRDVARVEAGLDDIRRISRTNGLTAVGLGIKKQRGSNAVAVADAVKKKMDEIRPTLPEGLKLAVNFDSTRFIKQTVNDLRHELVLAAILTAIVCLLFLASFTSTFNILLAIPVSIVGSFTFLYFAGFTINNFTMLGLILAIGIVVDDAIMILENIVRHQEMGKTPMQAAKDGAREITGAAVAATLAIIAIFIPVIFMKGIIGKFFFQFGVTMAVAVGLSLIEALTLTPMRLSYMKVKHGDQNRFGRAVDGVFGGLIRIYERVLRFCLNWRWSVILVSVALFAASFLVLPKVKKEFVPAQDQSMFLIRLQTPLGSSLAYTDGMMKQAEAMISKHPEVVRYFAAVGGFGGGEVNTGIVFVTLKDPKERPIDPKLGRPLKQSDLMSRVREELNTLPDLKVVIQDLSTRGFTAQRGFPVEFTVRGPDWEKLTQVSEDLMKKMKGNPYFVDVDTDYQFGQPEIQITPNRDAAQARQVSVEDIGRVINAMIGGAKTGKFTESGHRNDIRVRLEEDARQSSKDIDRLYVRNQRGELVKLSDVVTIKQRETLKSITRKDRERAIGIFANVGPGKSQDEALKEVDKLAKETLPAGYRTVLSGSAETFKESFQSLLFVLVLGIIVAYMVLGSQYNSFIHPFTVLLALPFSVSGAWLALYLTHQSLNIYSFIGVILLMGIVKKNSILLVDFTNQRREAGLDKTAALLSACPQRLRPVLMTSFATLAAAVPPALGLGAGSETRVPMATVIIGGVFISTLLTLFVVPCAYSLLAWLERKKYHVEDLEEAPEAAWEDEEKRARA
ncbi:efflux RND transporter permease subunit [Deltaproteobacteria bacterium PRO3]|nr:efflux RND transporter permease subunit [Deltaproteobacteria bacterium PRO3]